MYETLAVLALFTISYSLVSEKIEQSWVSGPIIFCAFGVAVGPRGFNLLPLAAESATIKSLAELTLALVLFTDAANTNQAALKKNMKIPVRLLLVGLPLTILFGFLTGTVLFDSMPWFEIIILAVILAPTDAALGKPVITNSSVPLRYREGLNIESGLNDGICVPVLFIFLELATEPSGKGNIAGMVLSRFVREIGIGGLTGVVLVAAVVFMGRIAIKHKWIAVDWSGISVVALALTCFALAQTFEGSGFIAAFTGGLVFGKLIRKKRASWLRETEKFGNLFSLVTWVSFGALVINPSPDAFRWQELLYSALSLTAIRMLPVFLSLTGLGLKTETKLFIGWFGPRGLASIVFCVIAFDAGLLHESGLSRVITLTVFASILLHGITAHFWTDSFGRKIQRGNNRIKQDNL